MTMQTEDKPDAEDEKETVPQITLERANEALSYDGKRLFIFSVIAVAYVESGVKIEFAQTALGKMGISLPGGLYITGLNETILLQGLGFVIFFFFVRCCWHTLMSLISIPADIQLKTEEGQKISDIIQKILEPFSSVLDTEKMLRTPSHRFIINLSIFRIFFVGVALYFILPLRAMWSADTMLFYLAIVWVLFLFVLFCRYLVRVNTPTEQNENDDPNRAQLEEN